MGSRIEYVDSSQMYATSYVRNSKAIAVLWAIFSICYAIVAAVAFATPDWIGDVDSSLKESPRPGLEQSPASPGRLGLWANCQTDQSTAGGNAGGELCRGSLARFLETPSLAFRAATLLVGGAVALAVLAILAMAMFFSCQATRVFRLCGWMQLLSAVCLVGGCLVYPLGWDEPGVRRLCGTAAGRYALGRCSPRWALLLAGAGCLDAVTLAALAFILATRHVRLQAEPHYATPSSMIKGEMNGGYMNDSSSVAGSRKSLNLHPVLMMHPPQDDTYSQFSQRTATARSKNNSSHLYSGSMHNFQL